ncbi:MAG: energy transducer TonB, partial [Arenimonas sp.]|uniref:energy transducer TonB n=1 Tax=Arenimonas sp. TaxID=1872635 RepID=UPI0025C062C7
PPPPPRGGPAGPGGRAPPPPGGAPPPPPVGVRTPQPSYPREAARSGVTGEVTVEISIAANGSVSDVRVIRAQPRGQFDRAVINTVREWQFEPMDAPAKLTRTFSFRP